MKRMPKEYLELAAWLAGCGDEEYTRDPRIFDQAFERLARAKMTCDRPLSAVEKYRRMSAEEKLTFRVETCRRIQEEKKTERLHSISLQSGIPLGTLERWLKAWRAGGVDALRFDYSKVGRKRKG